MKRKRGKRREGGEGNTECMVEEKRNPLPMKPPDITSSLHLHEQLQPRRFTSTGLATICEETNPCLDKARLYGEQISNYKAGDSYNTNQILRN